MHTSFKPNHYDMSKSLKFIKNRAFVISHQPQCINLDKQSHVSN
jgi:hypothetical protein